MKTKKNNKKPLHPSAALGVAWVAAILFIAGCGGGSSGSNTMPPPQQASLSYPSSSLVFTAGAAITSVVPTASQGLTTYTVTPALPNGLGLQPNNGTISGTPTAVSPATTYTITATGSGASATATVSITVNNVPPASPSYGAAALTFTTGVAARTLTPSASGGAVTSWSIAPALPAGLNFDPSSGTISGTPTATSAPASYVVTAQNSGGNSTATLTIEVDGGPLLDLGHSAGLSLLRMSGASVFSLDISGHWALWNYSSGAEIASGDLDCTAVCCGDGSNCGCDPNCVALSHPADLAGGALVLRTKAGFEVRSATTGDVISEITATANWWSVASDGSYIAAGSSSGLSAWLPSGDPLVSLSGDYSKAIAFADPGEVQVAQGPSGQNAIETITVPGGASTNGSAFNGQFSSWFVDGGRFITTAGTTALVYSQGSVQQAVITLPGTAPVVGQGNWVWTTSAATLDIFAIATGSTPAASFTVGPDASEISSGTSLAVANGSGGLSVIDLSGTTTPTKLDYTLPAGTATTPLYAAASSSEWMLGTGSLLLDGASLGGTARYLDYGEAWSIAGSNGAIAIATESGVIVYFDATTLTQEGQIPYPASAYATVLLSSDGSVLAELSQGDANIYSLPGGGLTYTWTGVSQISLSGSGAVLGQVNSSGCMANPTTGGTAIFSMTGCALIFVSPNGTLIATSSDVEQSMGNPNFGTNILQNGTLLTAVTGLPIGWIDDGHLLVNTFVEATGPGGGEALYAGCAVYSPSGQSTGPCALPEVGAFQPVTADSIYVVNLGQIRSISSGAVSWMSGDSPEGIQQPIFPGPVQFGGAHGGVAAVAGTRVVFESGAKVLAQGY